MRASRMLSDDEISELCVKCEKSGADFRVVFTDKHQTPKGRWLERHVPLIAKRFGAIGKFGCDGGALHDASGRGRAELPSSGRLP